MKNIGDIIGKNHLPVLFGTVAFGFLAVVEPLYTIYLRNYVRQQLPQLWAEVSNNGSYTQLAMFGGKGEDLSYAGKTNQVLIHGFPYDPHIRENRSLRNWLPDCLTFYITAAFAFISGDLNWAWSFTIPLFFYPLWFLLFYRIFRMVLQPKESVLATFILLLLSNPLIRYFITDWRHPAHMFQFIHGTLLGWTHPMHQFWTVVPKNIITNFLFYLALVVLGWSVARLEPVSGLHAIAIGLFFGLLCLIHFFEWVMGMIVLALVSGTSCFVEWLKPHRKKLALELGIASAISFLYVGLMGKVDVSELYRASYYFGYYRPKIHFLPWVLLATYQCKKNFASQNLRVRSFWLVLTAVCLTVFILNNQNIVTGVYPFLMHESFLGAYAAGVVLITTILTWVATRRPISPVWTVVLWLVLFFNIKGYVEQSFYHCGLPDKTEKALQWMVRNLDKDEIIVGLSEEIHYLVPVHTHCKTWIANGFPLITRMTDEEHIRRVAQVVRTLQLNDLFISLRCGKPEAGPISLGSQRFPFYHQVDRNLYEDNGGITDFVVHRTAPPPYPGWDRFERFAERVRHALRTVPAIDANFVLWAEDREARFFKKPPSELGGVLIYNEGGIQLYRFSKSGG